MAVTHVTVHCGQTTNIFRSHREAICGKRSSVIGVATDHSIFKVTIGSGDSGQLSVVKI